MARLPRYFVEGQPQHIIQRGNNREPIFATDEDYAFYIECLQDAAERHGCAIHAYILMTNHVHLLATPEAEQSIPKMLQSVGRRYVQYFNYTYKRTGTLWEGRYKATLIDSERYLLTCMRYIELNPVRAGIVKHPADSPWSSYHYNVQRVADPANPNSYRNPPKGDVYVEFDVPANRVLPHSKGTGRIPVPNSPDARVPGRNSADYKMPPATNIKIP